RHRRRRRGPHPGRRPAGDPVLPVGAEPGRDRAESGAESVLAPHPRRRRDGGRVAGRAAPQRPDRDARTVRRLHPRPRGLRGHPLAGHSPHAREARPPAPPPEPVDFAAEAHRPPSPEHLGRPPRRAPVVKAQVKKAMRTRFGWLPPYELRNKILLGHTVPPVQRFEGEQVKRLRAQLPAANGNPPLVTTIIPTYRRPEQLRAA